LKLIYKQWIQKAEKNIAKWGIQSEEILLLAMMEELGELSQAYLQSKYEHQPKERINKELADLMALGFQLLWKLEGKNEEGGRT